MNKTDITKKQLSSGFPFICYQDRWILCGQPQQADLKELQNLGWSSVLNLRNQEELENIDFNMPRTCEELGLEYKRMPIIINGELNKTALKKIHDLLHSSKDTKILIHCASGKRSVLALIAHLFLLGDHTKEELNSLAKQIGFDSPQMLAHLYDAIEN